MTKITSMAGSAVHTPPSQIGFSPPTPTAAASASPLAVPTTNTLRTNAPETAKSTAPEKPSAQDLAAAISSLQTKISAVSPELQFSVDETSGRSLVMLTDEKTKSVIWQFPSETALQISKALDIFQKGALVNRRV